MILTFSYIILCFCKKKKKNQEIRMGKDCWVVFVISNIVNTLGRRQHQVAKIQGFVFFFPTLLTLILHKFHVPQGPAVLDRG